MQKDLQYYNRLVADAHNVDDLIGLLALHISLVSDVRNKLPSGVDSIEIRTAISSYLQEIVDRLKRTKDNNSKSTSKSEEVEQISDDIL